MVTGPHANNRIITVDSLNAGLLQTGLKASRPTSAVGNTGMMYYCTDTYEVLRSNGTGTGGSLADGWDEAIDVDAAVSVGSLRTLGTGATQGAVGNHTHSIAASQHLKAEESFGAVSIEMATQATLSTFPKTLASQAITVGGSGKRALVYSGCVSVNNSNTAGITYTLAIKRDGVVKATIDSSSMGIGAKEIISVSGLEADVASGSYTITLILSASSAGAGEIANWTGGVLFISEGQVN